MLRSTCPGSRTLFPSFCSPLLIVALLLGLVGCPEPLPDDDDTGVSDDDDSVTDDDDSVIDDDDSVVDDDDSSPVDEDGDGFDATEDCDDTDPSTYPGADEVCDGVDNDCDGAPGGDEIDDDGDGQTECDGDCDDTDPANFAGNVEVCDDADNDCDGALGPEEVDDDLDGATECDGDCDDADPDRHPAADEVCDGIDNDCDPATNEQFDGDGDGSSVICDGDCDDADPANFPGNVEVCDDADNDCDGLLGPEEIDDDSDGQTECDGDCDDADAANFAGNVEACDDADNDCDGLLGVEEIDDDGDGVTECDGDCDDAESATFPGNVEVCDAIDNDCDATTWFVSLGFEVAATDSATGSNRFRGDKYRVDVGSVLDSFEQELEAASGDTLTFLVFESATEVGGYSLVASAATTVDPADDGVMVWHDSGPLDVDLLAGHYYALGVHWTSSVGYAYEGGGPTEWPATFGALVSSVRASGASLPAGADLLDNTITGWYPQAVWVDGEVDDDGDGQAECEGDCLDWEPAAFAGNAEVCDGLDNDCVDGPDFGRATWETVATTPHSYDCGTGSYFAHVYDVDASATIRSVEIWYGDADGDATVTAVVLLRATEEDDWTLAASAPIEPPEPTPDWLASDELDVEVPAGMQVGVGVFSTGTVEYTRDAGPGLDTDWGTWSNRTSTQADHSLPSVGDQLSQSIFNPQDLHSSLRIESDIELDLDGDDSSSCDDCDDANADAWPGNPAGEVCDGADNDCNGSIDEVFDFEPAVPGLGGDPIPDAGNLSVTAEVFATDPIIDLDVRIDIEHPWISDLDITLTSPAGTTVELTTDNGGAGDDYLGTVFDDEAADSITSGSAPFTGRWTPEGVLADFDGEVPTGDWTLSISDDASSDIGTLLGWELRFNMPGEGGSAACAASSCEDALLSAPAIEDGLVWIDPDGLGAYEVWCDQTTDGGGWTLILKASGDSTFGYTDPLWTDGDLLNDLDLDTDTSTNAKFEPFLSLPAVELRGCFPDVGHCIFADPEPGTAQEIFAAGSQQFGSGFDGQFYDPWSTQPNCQWFGINSPYQYQRTRFGFTANQENNCSSNDTAVGFGVGPYNTSGSSYGAGTLCTSTLCDDGNTDSGFPGLLWAR